MPADAGFEPQIGEIRAVRTFRVAPGGMLFPLFSRRPWVDGANEAICRGGHEPGAPAHVPPDPDCTCGFYAYADPSAAREYPHSRHVLAMLAECAPSAMTDYESDALTDQRWRRIGTRVVVLAAIISGLLPIGWIGDVRYGRAVWAGVLAVVLGAAALPLRRRRDVMLHRRRLLCGALALWMVAPFVGAAGIVFLRPPVGAHPCAVCERGASIA